MTGLPHTRRSGWGFLALMRYLERRAGRKPKVGKNLRVRDEIAQMGQDPYLHFPDSDLSDVDLSANPPVVRPRFLGLFGPFGPVPNTMTREVDHWRRNGDNSFVRFADIFTARFQQLFYRSWSDARAITQFDHPSGGSFPDQLRAFTGDSGDVFRGLGAVDDTVRLRYSALALGRVKSPVKLREILKSHFGVPIRIEEFVTNWLEFASEDLSCVGSQCSLLGYDMRVGSRARSSGETLTIHVDCKDSDQMANFLPGRAGAAEFKDLVLGYLGPVYDINVALWLPQHQLCSMQLGRDTSELGRMSALVPAEGRKKQQAPDGPVKVSQFRISQHA